MWVIFKLNLQCSSMKKMVVLKFWSIILCYVAYGWKQANAKVVFEVVILKLRLSEVITLIKKKKSFSQNENTEFNLEY